MTNLSTLRSKPVSECQSCLSGNHLKSLIFLGYVSPVNHMLDLGSVPDAEVRFPLELISCQGCGLVQIGYEVDQEILFPYSYPYLSGTTRILRENFQNLAEEVIELFSLQVSDRVFDIGANDGTLLNPFREKGYPVLGIEPSQAAELAEKNGIPIIKDYFSLNSAKVVIEKYGFAKVITAANVFAHMKDIHTVIEGVKHLLDTKGVFVSESHYLLDLVETLQYDTIYHEHLRYYSLHALVSLFERHGLEIIRVKRIPTHGGSIRVYACRKGDYPVDDSVALCLAEEKEKGLTSGTLLDSFRERVIQSKLELLKLLSDIKKQKKRVFGVGAPSRATTLINYTGLDDGLIDSIVEVSSSHKLDKFIPGTRIPVVDEESLYTEQPDYALLFSWHIAEELATNLVKRGFRGSFIIPLPVPRIFHVNFAKDKANLSLSSMQA